MTTPRDPKPGECWVNQFGWHYRVAKVRDFNLRERSWVVTRSGNAWPTRWCRPCRNHNPPRVLRRWRR